MLHRWFITRLAALTALGASATLLVVHFFPNPGLCPFESSCDQVVSSAFGKILGMPLPFLGVGVFALLFGLALLPTARNVWLFRVLALAAGAGGFFLILVQLSYLGEVCPFCMVVDVSAIVLAVAAYQLGEAPPLTSRGLRAWVVAAIAVAGLGVALGSSSGWVSARESTAVPPQVSAHWQADKINVVEIADFQCSHCRGAHRMLKPFLRERGDRVHFVRLMAPMPKHNMARFAARAYLAACAQGKGEEMAEALFDAEDLTTEGCERLAESIGLKMAAYRVFVANPATDASIDAELAWAQPACPKGLPVVWVQDRKVEGTLSERALATAFRDAERQLNGESR
jgi:uncharacterized membrane protein